MTLTPEEKMRRYEKIIEKYEENRRIRTLYAANREARLREKSKV